MLNEDRKIKVEIFNQEESWHTFFFNFIFREIYQTEFAYTTFLEQIQGIIFKGFYIIYYWVGRREFITFPRLFPLNWN